MIMKRMYFLVPSIETSKKIVDDLLLARIDQRHIHVLAKRGTPLEDLPEASFLQKSDFVPALERGMALGGLLGILLGVFIIASPGVMLPSGGTILATFLIGIALGGWISSMKGSSIGNSQIARFTPAIESGKFLIEVDVPRDRAESIEKLIKERYPQAISEGTEPTIPAFP
jgi:hypothetical protein